MSPLPRAAHRAPQNRPRALSRRGTRAAATVAAAALLAGCGVRLDTPPPAVPTPDAVEVLRQDAAVDAATITGTVSEITDADPAVAAALRDAAADAQSHSTALGGVWMAWPEGAPAGVATPEVSTAAPTAEPTARDALTLVREGAASARAGALEADDDALAAVLAAVSISRADAAADLAAALGEPAAASAGAPMTAEDLRGVGVDGVTVRVLDSARYSLETVAARSKGAAREDAAERATYLQGLVDAAIAAGAPDERMGAYDLTGPLTGPGGVEGADVATGPSLSAEQNLAVAAEQVLLAHWTYLLGRADPGHREALVAAAEDAAARVHAWGGTLPALPGLG
ncbi:DUF4439 domain-containing protein [Georgenia sp. SYP-B2076]|uniref:DUF4439 domain-containing protein n=1 Tax=Georgenia sp. SYP-B2076 TaxID=2495881 RepID=UPI000F8CD88A|nr:DUF4439 domain-containing protein [Georgenia sp. SYP-B2076]